MTTEERDILTAVRDDLLRRAAKREEERASMEYNEGFAFGLRQGASEITHYLEATE